MTNVKDWTVVVAPDGRLPETIRRLLALADHPTHVRTQGNSDLLVAPYIIERLNKPKRTPRRNNQRESGS